MKTRNFDRIGNGGVALTELGFGTAPMANLYRPVDEKDARDVLELAWESGVRYFDTAPFYGLGLAENRLNGFFHGKPRDEFVVSTKVGRLLEVCGEEDRAGVGKWFDVPCRREVFDYSYDGVMRSAEFSLERMGLDRIDILYAHDIDVFTHKSQVVTERHLRAFLDGGHKALTELREQGVIAGFGAGLNEWEPAEWLVDHGDPDIILLAGRYTLLEQEALTSFLPKCVERDVGIVIGGPYNSGILATGSCEGAHYNYDPAPPEILERVRRIEAVCQRHGVRIVDAAFQFPLCHPAALSVIPGGQTSAEMASNLEAANAVIPTALWAELKSDGLLLPDAPTP